jgi:hypothetical protein
MSEIIIIDDMDPNIQYSGPWFTGQNSQLTIGNHGPPFQNTLHGVNANASFSYSFSGMSKLFVCFIAALSLVHGLFFRIRGHRSRDEHNDKCLWDPRSNLGVFYRQY